MASKFLLLLIFMLSYHAHAKESHTVPEIKIFSDCDDSFDCDSQVGRKALSEYLGSSDLYETSHSLSKGSHCPTVLMNQYLDDCDDDLWLPSRFVDNARKRAHNDCSDKRMALENLPQDKQLDNKKLEKKLREQLNIKDIPNVTQCLDVPFTTKPFDKNPFSSKIRTLPKDQHQAFITEYYSNAHRLQQRMKSQINNIHSIDQILGLESSLNCKEHIISGLKEECKNLQGCSIHDSYVPANVKESPEEEKERKIAILEENQKNLANETIGLLQGYYQLEDESNKILRKCRKELAGFEQWNVSAIPAAERWAVEEIIEKECKRSPDYEKKVEQQKSLASIHPWIVSDKFRKLKQRIAGLDLKEKDGVSPEIPTDLTEQVKKSMIDQLKETRAVLAKEMPKTDKTYNCLIKNEECENIEGNVKIIGTEIDFFQIQSDGNRKSNIKFVLNSSPPITKINDTPDLIPHFENLQCQQDSRKTSEELKDFAKYAAADVGLILGGIGLSIMTRGASTLVTNSTTAASGARLVQGFGLIRKLKQGASSLNKLSKAQKASAALFLGDLLATGVLAEEAFNTCVHQLESSTNLHSEEKSDNNQCQTIKKYADIENSFKSCATQLALTTLGVAFPVGALGAVAMRRFKNARNFPGGSSPKKPMATKNPPQKKDSFNQDNGNITQNSQTLGATVRTAAKDGASQVGKKGDTGAVSKTNRKSNEQQSKDVEDFEQSGVTASGGKSGTEVIGTHVRTGGSFKQGGKPRSSMADTFENQFEVIGTQVARTVRTGKSSKQVEKRIGEILRRDKNVSQIRMSKDKDTLLTFKRTDKFKTSLYRVDRKGNIHKLSDDNLNKFLLAQHRVPLKNSSLAGLNKRVKRVRKGAARLKRGQTPKPRRNAPKETPDTVGKNVSPTIKNSQVATAARSVNNSDSVAPVVQNTMQKFPLVAAASRGVTRVGRLLSQYNKSGRQITQPTARLNEKANRSTASIDDKKGAVAVGGALAGGGAVAGGAAAVNKQVKVNSLDDCSKVKKGSYGYQICALQSRITHLNEKIAQAHVISQRLSLYLWSGVRHSAITPYFISELEIFLKNKKLATVEYQHLSRYMKNISIIQNRINENPNREIQDKMDQLLINFDQYIRNPAQQNLDNSQNLREEISLLDQLTRNS